MLKKNAERMTPRFSCIYIQYHSQVQPSGKRQIGLLFTKYFLIIFSIEDVDGTRALPVSQGFLNR